MPEPDIQPSLVQTSKQGLTHALELYLKMSGAEAERITLWVEHVARATVLEEVSRLCILQRPK